MLEELLKSQRPFAQTATANFMTEVVPGQVILSGSFNPLHQGHLQLAHVAERKLDKPVSFELSIRNVDKPPLEKAEIQRRLVQFCGVASIWVTSAATFLEKVELFPKSIFVVGFDTATRILDPKYYLMDASHRDQSLLRIQQCGCRFLVAGRIAADGQFHGLNDLDIPGCFENLFLGLSESEFRVDLSSTQIRNSSKV